MPNVRLRTIINQDNSTTFQVQFHEGGEWEDLTWDMISDKPFETLDDTVFIVDEILSSVLFSSSRKAVLIEIKFSTLSAPS